MIPTLIVLTLLALGVGIVAFATRRPATRQDIVIDQDTGWNDPISPANAAEADPFANAPAPTPPVTVEPAPADAIPAERPS
ncbi:MAG: hypothetical protein B7Y86_02480 [Brevundimonas subvibrioides]|uniref:Uncharacterized protein n=1 Tax=Brevundimonas subvibrioides TaxID=74313 RepID=A0A258HQC5_9CAUL|nr:hypothetical protein [Brevundimonas subvibrioides]OYX58572.1 MAG: hypothetical protein B7Y86_02480 [Brevundimonas subvibrioides]